MDRTINLNGNRVLNQYIRLHIVEEFDMMNFGHFSCQFQLRSQNIPEV